MSFDMGHLIVGLVQTFGFFVEGAVGFGCTVIAAPVTNGVLGTAVGVPYGTIIALPFLWFLAIKGKQYTSWKDLGRIVAACAPGIIIGQKLFYSISEQAAKISIGAMVCFIAIMNIHKHIVRPLVMKVVDDEDAPDTAVKKFFRYGCLILGGVVHGAFNIGGPLITVYTLEAVKDKKAFRNTMTSLWAILNLWNAVNQYQNGAVTPVLLSAMAIGIPFAAVGYWGGYLFLDKINRQQFLRMVYIILLLIGGNMFKSNVSWTPELIKMAFGIVAIVGGGYAFNVMKTRKANTVELKRA